jgi:DeoR/GlpR family transcriptional regulator of sugar metabolism
MREQRGGNLPARRRADLVTFIERHGQATIGELSDAFSVSFDTVRRDLDYLSSRGLVTRTHGGAVPGGELATADTPVLRRLTERREAKASIGAAAASLIRDHETVLINGGTTTLAAASALGALTGLTVVTNNLRIPGELPTQAVKDLYLIGGACRMHSMVTIGPVRFPDTAGISADIALIGVGGVHVSGFSISHVPEAQMLHAMMEAAGRVVVLADSSKFGRSSFAHLGALDEADILVTDSPPPDDLDQALRAAEVQVIVGRPDADQLD